MKTVTERVERKLGCGRLLATPEGARMLEELTEVFVDGPLVGPTELQTYFNLGAREVVMHLRGLRDAARREEAGNGLA